MIKEVKDFKRKELFEHYNSCDNPFVISTIKIDVTNVVNYCKEHRNFYATLGYLITKTANKIDAFKYRYQDEKIYYCEEVISNYTQMFNEDSIGYFDVNYTENFEEYVKEFIGVQKKFLEDNKYTTENCLNEIWLSCQPWYSFTGFVPPFNKEVTIPQFIWDKYQNIDGKYYINLMIMVHHGFADGFHIGKFVNQLQENIDIFNN